MLAEQRVAEAGVAIDRARRVRPQHGSLPELDSQLRAELKKNLTAANSTLRVEPAKAKVAKAAPVAPPRASTPSAAPSQPLLTQKQPVPSATTPPESGLTSTPSSARVVKLPPLLSLAPKVRISRRHRSLLPPMQTSPAVHPSSMSL